MSRHPLRQRLGLAFRLAWAEISGSTQRGAFDGGGVHRLLLDWIAQARLADEEIRGDIRRLRARARDLARNNSYIQRYFQLLKNNVVGPMGITLQGAIRDAAGDLDERANSRLESAWHIWAESRVTLDGNLTLRQLERLLIKTLACDGEAFVRLRRGPDAQRYGLALEPIDADLIDETYNRPREGTKNEIRMGIEIDALGRRVGYWIWEAPTGSVHVLRQRYFVSAKEMIHLYDQSRVNQTRGITWIHAVMVPAHMLNAYEESEAVAARIAASKMGWFEKVPNSSGVPDLTTTSKKPARMEANPGMFDIVPEGYQVKTWDPEHPTAQFADFVKQMARKIASGVSVFYNVLANDAEGVSYSTMRSFALVERDDWRGIQQDFIDSWRDRLFPIWLDTANLSGLIKFPSDQERDRHLAVRHQPRGWQWIDPEKEARAAVIAISNGLGTRTDFLAEKGLDIEDVFDKLAREKRLAAAKGITIDAGLRPEPVKDEEDEDGSGGGRFGSIDQNEVRALAQLLGKRRQNKNGRELIHS
jgi:lambda family phage portal protein